MALKAKIPPASGSPRAYALCCGSTRVLEHVILNRQWFLLVFRIYIYIYIYTHIHFFGSTGAFEPSHPCSWAWKAEVTLINPSTTWRSKVLGFRIKTSYFVDDFGIHWRSPRIEDQFFLWDDCHLTILDPVEVLEGLDAAKWMRGHQFHPISRILQQFAFFAREEMGMSQNVIRPRNCNGVAVDADQQDLMTVQTLHVAM